MNQISLKAIFNLIAPFVITTAYAQSNMDSMYFHFLKPKDDLVFNKSCHFNVGSSNYLLFSSSKAKLLIFGNNGDSLDVSVQGLGEFVVPFKSGEECYFYIYQKGFFPFKRNHLLMVTRDCFFSEQKKKQYHETIQTKSKYNADQSIIFRPVR
jgi:hypothetical protein